VGKDEREALAVRPEVDEGEVVIGLTQTVAEVLVLPRDQNRLDGPCGKSAQALHRHQGSADGELQPAWK